MKLRNLQIGWAAAAAQLAAGPQGCGPALDVIELAKTFNFTVVEVNNMHLPTTGVLFAGVTPGNAPEVHKKFGSRVITVNHNVDLPTKRFIVAYLLGVYVHSLTSCKLRRQVVTKTAGRELTKISVAEDVFTNPLAKKYVMFAAELLVSHYKVRASTCATVFTQSYFG